MFYFKANIDKLLLINTQLGEINTQLGAITTQAGVIIITE